MDIEKNLFGAVSEWLCRGLQILVRRFDSGPCLQFSHSPFLCTLQKIFCIQRYTTTAFKGKGKLFFYDGFLLFESHTLKDETENLYSILIFLFMSIHNLLRWHRQVQF